MCDVLLSYGRYEYKEAFHQILWKSIHNWGHCALYRNDMNAEKV